MGKLRDVRREIDQALRPDSREYGPFRGIVTAWDTSLLPEENFGINRGRKIGRGDLTHFGAIEGTDPDTLRTKLIDGVSSSGAVPTRFPLEPDNWFLRLHTEKGLGRDNVWSHRSIVEHSHLSQNRDHRSTAWIDQEDDMAWAWAQDVFWITHRRAAVVHDELDLDKAGFLASVTGNDGTGMQRGALAINVSPRGGFLADPKRIGQLYHFLTFVPRKRPLEIAIDDEDTNPKAKFKTLKEGLGGKLGGRADKGKKIRGLRPAEEVEACFRGDALFKFNDLEVASFQPAKAPDETPLDSGDILREAFIYVDQTQIRPLLNELDNLLDPSSNQPPIPKRPRHPFRFFLRDEEPTTSYYDSSYHGVPPASVYYYYAAGLGQPIPPVDMDNPDGSTRPPIESVDNKPPIFASRQVQHGMSVPNSPGYSQRFNIFPAHSDANPTNSFVFRKRKGATKVEFEIMAKPSASIPVGQDVELDILIGEYKDDKGPTEFSGAKMVFDSTTPSGEDAEYTRFVREFVGFQKDEEQLIVILGRRNDLKPIPNVEIWQLSLRARSR